MANPFEKENGESPVPKRCGAFGLVFFSDLSQVVKRQDAQRLEATA